MKLTATQTTTLTTAAARADGAILPLPTSIRGGAIGKVCDALEAKGLASKIGEGGEQKFVISDDDRRALGLEIRPAVAAEAKPAQGRTGAPRPPSGGPSGYDAGKKVKSRKRQVIVDTAGRGLILEAQAASVHDRDAAPIVLRLSRRSFADSGYAGERPATATSIDVEIVRKPKDQTGFAVHPRRWVVKRFFT